MCQMRFDLGADVESIEGDNKSKKKKTTLNVSALFHGIVSSDATRSVGINSCRKAHITSSSSTFFKFCIASYTRRSYSRLCIMFAGTALTSVALCQRRAKTDNAKRVGVV